MVKNRGDEVKEAIVQASLDLFADKGVVETYVRDISRRAGIRESTLYYYFSGKEDIINSISDEYNQMVLTTFRKIIMEASKEEYVDSDTIANAIHTYTYDFLMGEFAIKYERIMRMELNRNAKIAEDYIQSTFVNPVAFLEAFMSFLSDIGYIKAMNNHLLAETIVAMISFIFTKHAGVGEVTETGKKAYATEIKQFIEGFMTLIILQKRVKITEETYREFRAMALEHFPSVSGQGDE